MKNLFLALGSAFCFLLCFTSCAKPIRKPRYAEAGSTFKVMSFNVNFGLPSNKSSVAAIANSNADIVLLQETNEAWEKGIRASLSHLYPHMAFHHCCRAGGLAILSKGQIHHNSYFETGDIKGSWFPAWRHVVQTPIGLVQTLNVHLRPQISARGSVLSGYFSTPPIRRKEIESYFSKLDGALPTLIAGDFNESESGKAVRFLHKRGLRSAIPEFSPGADTWRWTTSLGTVHSQLDHIAYDPRLEPVDAKVLKQGASDHFPIVATFVRSSP